MFYWLKYYKNESKTCTLYFADLRTLLINLHKNQKNYTVLSNHYITRKFNKP